MSKVSICGGPPHKNTRMTDFSLSIRSAASACCEANSPGRLRPRKPAAPICRNSRRERPSHVCTVSCPNSIMASFLTLNCDDLMVEQELLAIYKDPKQVLQSPTPTHHRRGAI